MRRRPASREGSRRSVLVAVAAVLALALVPAFAFAGDTSSADPAGDVVATGLTANERRALDIVSVQVTGEEGLGVFVTVTFRGNIQRAIGRGALEEALVAFILR